MIGNDMDIGVEGYQAVSTSPTDEFNNFSYEIQDADIQDLRSAIKRDIVTLEDSVNRDLASVNIPPSQSELQVRDVFKQIADKYHVEVGYDTFKDLIHDISNYSNEKKEMMDAILVQVTTSLVQRANLKLVISLTKLIDKMVSAVEMEADSQTELNLDVVVNTIDRCMMWYQQLVDMRNQFTIKDPIKTLERNADKIRQENGEEIENDSSTVGKVDPGVIKNLIKQLQTSAS